jgi:hypothetical protein
MRFESKRFDSGQFFFVSFFDIDTLSLVFNYGNDKADEVSVDSSSAYFYLFL